MSNIKDNPYGFKTHCKPSMVPLEQWKRLRDAAARVKDYTNRPRLLALCIDRALDTIVAEIEAISGKEDKP